MAENAYFKLQVYTPNRIFFEEDVDMIELTTTEGDVGIYKNHIPLTAIVAPGILRIHKDGNVREAALLEGFLEILPDQVTVLAEACEWPEEIDRARAEEARIRAERRLKAEDNVNYDRAEMALKKALLRLQLSDRYH